MSGCERGGYSSYSSCIGGERLGEAGEESADRAAGTLYSLQVLASTMRRLPYRSRNNHLFRNSLQTAARIPGRLTLCGIWLVRCRIWPPPHRICLAHAS